MSFRLDLDYFFTEQIIKKNSASFYAAFSKISDKHRRRGVFSVYAYCRYVDDLIDGFIKLFFKEGLYQPINLGNPAPINMLELAKETIELTQSKSQVEMRPLPGDDPKQREPMIEKAEKILGWKPIVDRRSGLIKTIEYFKSTLN